MGPVLLKAKTICHSVYLGNKRSGLRMNETETRCDKDIPEEYGTPRGKSCHFCIAPHEVVLLHHYSIIPLSIRIGRAALLRSTSCHCICSPCAKVEGRQREHKGVWSKMPKIRLGFHGAGPVVILNVGESRNQHDQAADDEHQLHVDECQLKPERIGKRPGEHGPEKAQSLK